jgi:hypothetical protein
MKHIFLNLRMKTANNAVAFVPLFDGPVIAFKHHGCGYFPAAKKGGLVQFQ